MAHRDFVTHPLVLRRLDVLAVRDVTPRMRRVTLGGPEMGGFERDGLTLGPFHSPTFDDHVKAIFADPAELPEVLPTQLAQGIEWTAAPARIARDYTPRRVDAASRELDLDFVLYGHGPASDWAREARVGDDLWIVGPKSSIVLPERLDWIVLVGDETALPAIGRFLDERPLDVPARIVVTIEQPFARQDLAVREGDALDWVVASPTDRATLEKAVRAVVPADGDGFVWAAGESRTLLPLRRFLGRERGMPKDRVCITGYWHADDEELGVAFPEVPSPVAWLAVRAACESGLVDLVADRPGTPASDLAERLGTREEALAALLPTLAHHGIVAEDAAGRLVLGAAGEALLADEHVREVFDGHEARVVRALVELPDAMSGSGAAWGRVHGSSLANMLETDEALFAEQCEEAAMLRFFARGLFEDPVWDGAHRALLTGPGAAELAGIAREAGVGADLLFGGGAAQRRVLLGLCDHGAADDDRPVDVAALALALGDRTDAEAHEMLTGLLGRTGSLVVVERARPDSLDPAAHEAHVRALAVNGVGLREAEAVGRLGADAGWRLERSFPLGWGIDAMILAPAP